MAGFNAVFCGDDPIRVFAPSVRDGTETVRPALTAKKTGRHPTATRTCAGVSALVNEAASRAGSAKPSLQTSIVRAGSLFVNSGDILGLPWPR